MFLSETDYETLITDEDREFVEQSSEANRTQAELMAIDQMKGYLRQKYDVEAVFDLEAIPDPDTRAMAVVMYCMDITLYHLHAMLPGRFMPEIRRIRYEDAIAWLKDIAKGLIDPGLPPLIDPISGEETGQIRYGSNEARLNEW